MSVRTLNPTAELQAVNILLGCRGEVFEEVLGGVRGSGDAWKLLNDAVRYLQREKARMMK